jgi:hypothetical protein
MGENLGALVKGFIDTDPKKIGTQFINKPVIDVAQYKALYRDCYILISMRNDEAIQEAVTTLEESSVNQYFLRDDSPMEVNQITAGHCWEEQNFPFEFNRDENNVIYGVTAYSLLLYQYLIHRGCKTVSILPQTGTRPGLIEAVRKISPDIRMVGPLEADGGDKLFNALEDTCCVDGLGKEVIDVFDWSVSGVYKNINLEKFKGIYKGKRCFIIGCGPSLSMSDLDKLDFYKELSIGTNKIFYAFSNTSWRPTYYIAEDLLMMELFGNEIKHMDVSVKLLSDLHSEFWEMEKGPNIYKFHSHEVGSKNKLPKVSDDFSMRSYCGPGTVTYAAIQFAIYLEVKEIILLGMDFDYHCSKNGTPYFDQKCMYKVEEQGIQNRKDMESKFFMKDTSLNGFIAVKEYANRHQINVYNATRGGKLEVFTRVDFDKLF